MDHAFVIAVKETKPIYSLARRKCWVYFDKICRRHRRATRPFIGRQAPLEEGSRSSLASLTLIRIRNESAVFLTTSSLVILTVGTAVPAPISITTIPD